MRTDPVIQDLRREETRLEDQDRKEEELWRAVEIDPMGFNCWMGTSLSEEDYCKLNEEGYGLNDAVFAHLREAL